MRLLTIETSTPTESVAVVDAGLVAAEERAEAGRGHAERLAQAVSSALERSGFALGDLDGIAVSIGPGRFSGLRVGLASAKGLSLTTGLPVFGVSTLEALALSAGAQAGERLVAPILDARRGEVYGALFATARVLARLLPDTAAPPEAFAREVRGVALGRPIALVGTGALAYGSEVSRALGGVVVFPERQVLVPAPEALARLAHEAAALSPQGADLESLEPIYMRGV